jgi:membrane-associated phospholipid phosphatase
MFHLWPPAEPDAYRGTQHRFLPPLPALVPRLVAIAILAVVYLAMTIAITAGLFTSLDLQVAAAAHAAWQPALHTIFQVIALLGGIELTTILMVGLFLFLLRRGFGSDALGIAVVFITANLLELFYKRSLYHPGPPLSIAQADGPSLTHAVVSQIAYNSFPSGHVVRAVLVYGLFAFVIRRLAASTLVRALAVPLAVVVIVVVSFDRIYLDVHWESDVIGGLILGAIALLAGTVWLDRPRKPEN